MCRERSVVPTGGNPVSPSSSKSPTSSGNAHPEVVFTLRVLTMNGKYDLKGWDTLAHRNGLGWGVPADTLISPPPLKGWGTLAHRDGLGWGVPGDTPISPPPLKGWGTTPSGALSRRRRPRGPSLRRVPRAGPAQAGLCVPDCGTSGQACGLPMEHARFHVSMQARFPVSARLRRPL